jgi:hypothetical protein
MVGVGVLAYLLIAGGSLLYCAALNLKYAEVSGNEVP